MALCKVCFIKTIQKKWKFRAQAISDTGQIKKQDKVDVCSDFLS